MVGNNIEITATKVNNQGGNLNLSGDTSVNIASGGGIYLTTTNAYTGTKAISIDQKGIDLASNSNIELRAGGHINIYSGSEQDASAFKISKDDGIWIGSSQKINLSASSSKIEGSNGSDACFSLTPERILLGVTTSNSTSAVDIKSDSIIIGIANAVTGMENMKVTLDGTASGVQIKKDYIGMAVGNADRRSIVSLEPTRIFIGIASEVTTTMTDASQKTKTNGGYIEIVNSGVAPSFEIGSTGKFAVLTPTFKIDNAATGTTNMLYLANNTNWDATTTSGIRFSQTNGLEIKAKTVNVEADQLYFGTQTAEDRFQATVRSTKKYYKIGTSASIAAPTDADTQGWSTAIPTATSGNPYVFSTIETITEKGDKSYTEPINEGTLSGLSTISYKRYKRTSTTTKPTCNTSNYTEWELKIPKSVQTTTTENVNTTTGQLEHTKHTAELPYLWSCVITDHVDGSHTFEDVQREEDLEKVSDAWYWITDAAAGNVPVPYVKSTGLIIDGNYVSLQAEGKLQLLGNSGIYIGTDSSNSSIILNKDGIAINSNGSISINTGGTFTVQSGKFSIDSAGNVTMTGAITSASGSIGPWQILSDRIYNSLEFDNDESNESTGIGTVKIGTETYGFWAGDGAFSVTQDGVVRCKKMIVDGQEVNMAG